MAPVLLCPECGAKHPLDGVNGSAFPCKGCGRTLKVPQQVPTPAVASMPARRGIPICRWPRQGGGSTRVLPTRRRLPRASGPPVAHARVAPVCRDAGRTGGLPAPPPPLVRPRSVRRRRRVGCVSALDRRGAARVHRRVRLRAEIIGVLTTNQIEDVALTEGLARFVPIARLLPFVALVTAGLVHGGVYGIAGPRARPRMLGGIEYQTPSAFGERRTERPRRLGVSRQRRSRTRSARPSPARASGSRYALVNDLARGGKVEIRGLELARVVFGEDDAAVPAQHARPSALSITSVPAARIASIARRRRIARVRVVRRSRVRAASSNRSASANRRMRASSGAYSRAGSCCSACRVASASARYSSSLTCRRQDSSRRRAARERKAAPRRAPRTWRCGGRTAAAEPRLRSPRARSEPRRWSGTARGSRRRRRASRA